MFTTYPEIPVVPLCEVHPLFGKVTTLNNEKTRVKKKTTLKKNLTAGLNVDLDPFFELADLMVIYNINNHYI